MKKSNSRLCIGDSTAGVRLDAVNAKNMDNYFQLLNYTYNQFGFAANPETIFNMDETGMPLCPHPLKVIARKGKKRSVTEPQGRNLKSLFWHVVVQLVKSSPHLLYLLRSRLVCYGLRTKFLDHVSLSATMDG